MSRRSTPVSMNPTRIVAVVLVCAVAAAGFPAPDAGAADASQTRDEAFVTAAYHDFLGRAPTSAERAYLTAHSLRPQSARAALLANLTSSPEWVGATVDKMYQDTLGREPDAGGRSHWIGVLSRKELSVAAVAAQFYSSAEYFQGFGSSSVATWVADLYLKLLLRPADPGGAGHWVTQTAQKGRTWVAAQFYGSAESRATRVKNLYLEILDREPDTAGWSHWTNELRTTGDLTLAAWLAESFEYDDAAWHRYGQPVSRSGPVTRATLSSQDGTIYRYAGTTSSLSVTQAGTTTPNVREVFWVGDTPLPADQQVCVDWTTTAEAYQPLVQPGVALRIAPVRPDTPGVGTKAITVTQNIWAHATSVLNVHVWDSTQRPLPYEQIAQFNVAPVVGFPTALVAAPWHVCARTIGNRLDVKIWTGSHDEPAWDDSRHVHSTGLPADYDHPGHAGGYVGHVLRGQNVSFANLRSEAATPILP